MKKQLKISIAHSESADQVCVGGTDSCALIKDFLERNDAEAISSSAGELNQADGLLCVITDNDYEEVRKCLNYSLDKDKKVAYFLEDDVTLDEGMRLQLGRATNLGKLTEDMSSLRDWISNLDNARRISNRKRNAMAVICGVLITALIIAIAFWFLGRRNISPEGNAEVTLPENYVPKETNSVMVKNIENLTALDLSGQNITDISFIKDGMNLEELDLSNNAITDISALAKLTKLKKLNISNNAIEDINILLAIPELEEVDVSGNPIKDYTVLDYMKDVDWKS